MQTNICTKLLVSIFFGLIMVGLLVSFAQSTLTQAQEATQIPIEHAVETAAKMTANAKAATTQTTLATMVPQSCADFDDIVFDDFAGTEIDESNWEVDETDREVFSVHDDALYITLDRPHEDSVGEAITALLPREKITAVCLTVTLESYAANVPGGAGFVFYLENGQDFSVDVGPGSEDPGVEIAICPTPTPSGSEVTSYRCSGDYDDYKHPLDPNVRVFPVGRPVLVRAAIVGDYLEFYIYVNPLRPLHPPPVFVGDSVIEGLEFSMYADEGGVYSVTVDGIYLGYTDD